MILALIALFQYDALSQERRLYRDDAKDTVFKVPEKHYDNLEPGSIAPDAVYVDCDFLEGIVNGAVLAHKGPLHALLDLNGNFVSPWGKYKFTFDRISTYTPLINVYGSTGGQRLINAKGNTIVHAGGLDAVPWFRLITVNVDGTNASRRMIDMSGNVLPKISLKHTLAAGTNLYYQASDTDLIPFTNHVPNETGKMPVKPPLSGYLTKKGVIKIPPIFNDTTPFSEGLAAVEKIDEFGISKWGYIDINGKVIIPYTFQNRPGSFHNNLALVKPKNKADFDYGYIDRQGTVKIKVGQGNYHSVPKRGDFINGYSFWDRGDSSILDTNGRFHTIKELIKDDYTRSLAKVSLAGVEELGIYITCAGYSKNTFGNYKKGMIDYSGNLLFPPVFENLLPDLYSTHAIATYTNISNKTVTGVVNSQGIFILVQKPKSTF